MGKKIFSALFVVFLFLSGQSHATVAEGWEKHIIAEQKTPIYLYVKDIDRDGDLDVVSTTNRHPNLYNSEVAWFQNNLNLKGPWKKIVISSSDADKSPVTNANGITVADIDADGLEDVAVACGMASSNAGSIHWFKAPKDPAEKWKRYDIKKNVKNTFFKIYALDINEDKKIDLTAGGTQGAIIFLNPGNPCQQSAAWQKIPLSDNSGKTGSSIYLDDLNGDGKLDLINSYEGEKANDNMGNISWFDFKLEGGRVTFNRIMIDPKVKWAFDNNCMDVNGDNRKDVLVTIFKDLNIYWYEAPAKEGGPWIKHSVTNDLKGTDLYTGDIDGDKKSDFVVAGLFQKKISWFKYNSANQSWTEKLIDDDIKFPGDISLDDLDGDGDVDVVIAGMGVDQMIWYENKIKGKF
jgi:hypothetical protein